MRLLLSSCWVGILYTGLTIIATLAYTSVFGRMFDEWGWLQLSIALLIFGVLIIAVVSGLDHQPNPYGRTNPLYNLRDVPDHNRLESAGFGWITQPLPMVVAAVFLLLVSRFL